MNIVINGASGFLGRHLLARLLQEDDCTMTAVTSAPERLAELFPGTDRIHFAGRYDRLDWSNVDVFVNAAFPRNFNGREMADGLNYIAENLEEAARGGAGAVINISSQSVYVNSRERAADEESELELDNTYAVGKYASELLTDHICREIPHTNIRLASLIGPGFNQRLVNKFAMSVKDGKALTIKDGPQYFGFMDVRDAADGLAALIRREPADWKDRYVLGTPTTYTLVQLAETVVKVGSELGYRKRRVIREKTDSPFNSGLDPRRFMEDFDWHPVYSMEETIREIFLAL